MRIVVASAFTLLGMVLASACSDSKQPADQGTLDRLTVTSEFRSTDGRPSDTRPWETRGPDRPRPPARWETLAAMATARFEHTATTLQDGTVLVAGGWDSKSWTVYDTAERYDPKTNKWTAVGKMSTPHWGHAAVLLDDGRVLVVGGCRETESNTCMLNTGVELYDPQTDTWKKGPAPISYRRSMAISRLADGRVVVGGGYDNQKNLLALEIYDPKANSWSSPSAVLSTPRNKGTATALKNGKVVFAGGSNGTVPVDTLDVFDPQTGAVKMLSAKLAQPRWLQTATLLGDGRVLFAGGTCALKLFDCDVAAAELYDPATDKATSAGSPGTGVRYHTATLLADGRVAIVGGDGPGDQVMLFDPATLSWAGTAPMSMHRTMHAAALAGERVIVTGGVTSVSRDSGSSTSLTTAAVEAYTP